MKRRKLSTFEESPSVVSASQATSLTQNIHTGLREQFAIAQCNPDPDQPRNLDLVQFGVNRDAISPLIKGKNESFADWKTRLYHFLESFEDKESEKYTFWEGLIEMALDVAKRQVRNPLVINIKDGKNLIIGGERRYWCAVMASLNYVPARLVDEESSISAQSALLDNLFHKQPSDQAYFLACSRAISLIKDEQGNLLYNPPKKLPSLDEFLEITRLGHTKGNKMRTLMKRSIDDPVISAFVNGDITYKKAFELIQKEKQALRNELQPEAPVLEDPKPNAPKKAGRKIASAKVPAIKQRTTVKRLLMCLQSDDIARDAVSDFLSKEHNSDADYYKDASEILSAIVKQWEKAEDEA